MKRSRALTGMIASRMAFGVAVWAFPGPVGKAFGVDITGIRWRPTWHD